MKSVWGWLLAALTVAVTAALIIWRGSLFVVVSDSMAPAIRAGDVVVLRPASRSLRVGDVVSYRHNGMLITHRVVATNGETLTTKGDSANSQDPWEVPASEVRGLVWLHVPYLGWLIAFIRTPQGWVGLVLLPCIVLLALEVRDLLRQLRGHGKERAARRAAGGGER